MISALNLLWIVPLSCLAGVALMALLTVAADKEAP